MSYPGYPEQNPNDPTQQYPQGYQQQGFEQPGFQQPGDQAGYQQPGYQQPGYPQPGYQQPYGAAPYGAFPGAPDAGAPYGRDPLTGEPLSDKSKLVAGLLQIFLGGFGVGRFYIGDNTIGAIQLALTIIGWITAIILIGFILIFGVAVWALIDGIMMLTGSVRDPNGLKLRN